eukprot:CAMPEP_0176032028 /NCGR_PEP_ID=MMETSP0120_2-20121206/15802_1 /TAXON_ID=160619 /ORGANISM="Kryptoperidinium foliaceum, Strain CCMP 1326" /LENGTH=159 /DNA_ID=CAMNT_0017365337 /DNA_START=66 /DNA_END=540 /DNA_ORIENTATION=-
MTRLLSDGEHQVHSESLAVASRIATSAWFRILTTLAILMNATMIGVETQKASVGERPALFQRLNFGLNVAFLFELVIRLVAEGKEFFISDERWGNIMDMALVILGVGSDIAIMVSHFELEGGSVWKVIRLLRIMRTLRILRTVKSVREFQKMLYALMSS